MSLSNISQLLFRETYFYFLLALTAIIGVIVIRKRRLILEELYSCNKSHLALVFIIFLIALYYRTPYARGVAPVKFFTEQLAVANAFFYHREAAMCTLGTFKSCILSTQPIHPNGYAFIIYLFLLICGNSFTSYMICAVLISSLTVFAVYHLSLLLLGDSRCGVIAALIIALLPEHMRITLTRPVIAASILFVIITLNSLLISIKHRKDGPLFLLSLLLLVFSAHLRYENITLVFVFAAAYALYGRPRIPLSKLCTYTSVAIVLALPLLFMHLGSSDALVSMFGSESAFGGSLDKLTKNAQAYNRYFTNPYLFRIPLLYLILIGLGVLVFRRSKRRALALMGTWVAVYGIAYLFHKNIGYHRYAMHLFPQYALLAGIGISYLIRGSVRILSRFRLGTHGERTQDLLMTLSVVLIFFSLSALIGPVYGTPVVEYAALLNEVPHDAYVMIDDTNAMVFLNHRFALLNYGGYQSAFFQNEYRRGSDLYWLQRDQTCEQCYVECERISSEFLFTEISRWRTYTLSKVTGLKTQ